MNDKSYEITVYVDYDELNDYYKNTNAKYW